MFLTVVVRSILGAIVGYFVGVFLLRVTLAYDQYRLNRMWKRTNKAIDDAFAPIRELDSRRW
jgi:membrane protein YqaA with SNARE-associated domain